MLSVLMLTLLAAPGDAPATWAREALACKTTPKWQRTWAERVLAGKHKAPVTVFVTNYGLWDRHPFKGDYYHIASNVLPKGTVVYLEADRTLKVVTNCGARRNDRWARHPRRGETRKPAAYWVDRWTKRARHDNANTRLWVVGNAPWPH